jgi:hypothetical protein
MNVEYTDVSLTPQRFGALRMTASMISDDMSKPAEFAGKLYRNSGIWSKSTFEAAHDKPDGSYR